MIGDVGARDIPEIVVFNKADLVDDDTRLVLRGLEPKALFASSRTGEGIDELRAAIEAALPLPAVEVRALVPYDRGDLVSAIHEQGIILSQEHEAGGTAVCTRASGEHLAAELAPFALSGRAQLAVSSARHAGRLEPEDLPEEGELRASSACDDGLGAAEAVPLALEREVRVRRRRARRARRGPPRTARAARPGRRAPCSSSSGTAEPLRGATAATAST